MGIGARCIYSFIYIPTMHHDDRLDRAPFAAIHVYKTRIMDLDLREKLHRCKLCDDHGIVPKNEFTLKCRNLECDGTILRPIVQGFRYIELNTDGTKIYFQVEERCRSIDCLTCHNNHAINKDPHQYCGVKVYGTESCLEASERHHRETSAILSALSPPGTSLYSQKPTTAEEFAAQLSTFRSLYSANKLKWCLAMALVQEENKTLKEEIESLKNGEKMKKLENEFKKLEKNLSDQKAFASAILVNTNGLADLKTEMEKTMEQEKIVERLNELESERAQKNQEIAKWKWRSVRSDEHINKISEERDKFKGKLAEIQSENEMHVGHISELKRNNFNLQRSLTESQKKFEAQHPNQDAIVQKLREEIAELKEQKANLAELLHNNN